MKKNSFIRKLDKIFKSLGLKPKDLDIYFIAFTHPSYANENNVENNERLEFLGDAVLEFLVTDFLYKHFPNHPEGKMSKMRSVFVCTKANAEYASMLNLETCLLLGKGEKEHGGSSKSSVLANLFEAFLGAVYLDLGLGAVNNILNKVMYHKLLNFDDELFTDYKTQLQEHYQAISKTGVEYTLVKEIGPSHDKIFTVSVFHQKKRLGTGIGRSKKQAEQNAAKDALNKVK